MATPAVMPSPPLSPMIAIRACDARRALLEQRSAAVVRQMRRLAIELTGLDRQLDEIEQSSARWLECDPGSACGLAPFVRWRRCNWKTCRPTVG